MSSVTNYLRMRRIELSSSFSSADYNFNLERIDLLAQAIRVQSGTGQSLGLRCQLVDGTLAEFMKVTPQTDGSLVIEIGRAGVDNVIVN